MLFRSSFLWGWLGAARWNDKTEIFLGIEIPHSVRDFRKETRDYRKKAADCQLLLVDVFFHLRLPQKPRRFLRRRRIDVKARAPLESRRLGEFRNDLQMPVIVIVCSFL